MDLQPRLVGRFLRTRPLTKEDFEVLYLAASDPLIWEQHPDPLRFQRDAFQKYFDSGIDSQGCLIIEDATNGEVIGSSRFYDFLEDQKQIKVGFTFLKRSYWGRQFNRELKRLMLNYAFTFVDTVLFEVGRENLRSRKALEKIGAVLNHHYESKDPAGREVNKMIYSIKKTDFWTLNEDSTDETK